MKQKLFFILTLYTTLAFSQQETGVWYFGKNAGLRFNQDGSVTALSDGKLNIWEGCATISNNNGDLLFYTDGRTVYDKNHVVMPNGNYVGGTGLLGDPSSTQSAIIVPKPGNPDVYYIFTLDEPHHENAKVYPNAFSGKYIDEDSGQTPDNDDGLNNGLNYSIVDLSIIGTNGSIGDIVSRNNHLITYDTNPVGEDIKYKCSEKLAAVKDATGNDFWVITQFTDYFYSFKVTSNGVNSSPVKSILAKSVPTYGYRKNGIGYLKISPNGKKVAAAFYQIVTPTSGFNNYPGYVYTYDFDNATGIVSNPKLIISDIIPYGVEFSGDSNVLYASYYSPIGGQKVSQFDLLSGNIPSTKIVLFESNYGAGALQLAPNKKIYYSGYESNSLAVINNPTVLGLGCNFEKTGQLLAANTQRGIGLPQFITSYFDAPFTAENLCLGANTQFTMSTTIPVTSATWDFGDGNTSTDINPNHKYAVPGKYLVTVNATTPSGKGTNSKEITIFPTPILANPIPNQSVCGAASMNYNLSQHNTTLLGSQSTTIFGVAYFFSQDDANKHTNLLPNTFALPIGTSTIYAKIYNLSNTSCNAITSFTITLNKQPLAHVLSDFVICENLPYDNIEQFDLATKNTAILNGQNSSEFTISYHKNQLNADDNKTPLPLVYTNTLPEETLYVRVENKTNPACFATTALNLKVVQEPKLTTVTNFLACDDASNDGIASYDLTQKTTEILNGQSASAFEVKYYYSQNNAQDNTDEIKGQIKNTTNNQDIYYSISAIGNSNCKVISSFKLVVNSLPMANTANPIFICDDATNDGLGTFNLENNSAALLGTQNPNKFTVSYYENQSDAYTKSNPLSQNYQNKSNPQTIFARIENNHNSSCFATTSFQIGLYKMPTANQVKDLITCDDDSNDSKEIFDLASQNALILGTQSLADFTISYHQLQEDANSGTKAVSSNYTNTANPQTIYARLVNTLSPICYATTSFQLIVKKKPELNLNEQYSICEGKSITIIAPSGFSSYLWSNNVSTPKTVIREAGDYSLTVTKNYGDITCETKKDIVVTNSNIATITKIETQDWTNTENTITIYATGDGDYEYSIDGINYQDSPQFAGLKNGQYKIYVKDKKGCGIKTDEVFLLMYPKFFTPNGDGTNDSWHINYSNNEPQMKLIIYDRYGKMITSYNGLNAGWDGKYNGQLLPSDDYWFVVQRENGTEYKGHFSLKR